MAEKLFFITHTDDHGEKHQLAGAWKAKTAEHALEMMLIESQGEDDGRWEVHEVTP